MKPRLPLLVALLPWFCSDILLSFSLSITSLAAEEDARPCSYLLAWERTFELAEADLVEAVLVDSVSFSELRAAGEEAPFARWLCFEELG